MSRLRKALFTVVVLTLTLVLFEVGLRFSSVGKPKEMMWIRTSSGWGTCYSEDEAGYYPLSIRESKADRARLARGLVSCHAHYALEHLEAGRLSIDELARRAPHCMLYDTERRRRGFFGDRRRRIALVGDSFAFGEGVKDRDTLGYRLGLTIKDANFLNHARPGADISVVRSITTALINKEQRLDGVIYVFNLNDIFFEGGGHPDTDIDTETAILYGFDRHLGKDRSFSDRVVSASRILTLVKKIAVQRRRTERTVDAFIARYHLESSDYRRLTEELVSIASAARSKKVPFHVAIYPLLYKDPLGDYPFASIHDKLAGLCLEKKLSCVDIYPAFAGERTLGHYRINVVDSHPNGAANQIVADFLAAKAPHLFR